MSRVSHPSLYPFYILFFLVLIFASASAIFCIGSNFHVYLSVSLFSFVPFAFCFIYSSFLHLPYFNSRIYRRTQFRQIRAVMVYYRRVCSIDQTDKYRLTVIPQDCNIGVVLLIVRKMQINQNVNKGQEMMQVKYIRYTRCNMHHSIKY